MCGCVIESVSTNSGIEVTEAPIVSQDSYHLKIPPKIYEKREKRNIQLLTQDTKGIQGTQSYVAKHSHNRLWKDIRGAVV